MSDEGQLRILESKVNRVEADLALAARLLAGTARRAGALSGAAAGCVVTFDVTVQDSGTGAAVPGAAVSILSSGGITVAAGVADASGQLTLFAGFADAFTFSVSASGYDTATGPATGACGDTVAVAVALAGVVTVSFCTNPVPMALQGVDSRCSVTVNLDWDSSSSKWLGCASVQASDLKKPFPLGTGCSAGATPCFYQINSSGQLLRRGVLIAPANQCYDTSASCSSTSNVNIGSDTRTSLSCGPPLHMVFDIGSGYTLTVTPR